MPESLKEDAQETAESLGYTGLSEFVRDAVRDKIDEQLELRSEVAEKVLELRDSYPEMETISTEEARERLDIE